MYKLRYLAIALVAMAAVVVMPASMASAKLQSAGSAQTTSKTSVATAFTEPVHVNTTYQGCRNDGSITLPNGSGQFICPDTAYTSGNLGKGWNELDLVPYQLDTSVGTQSTATKDYNIIIAADYSDNGNIGYDVISAPTINSSSDASCTLSAGAQSTGPSITGGADVSIFRTLTIHQNKGTTCRFDWYQRLALGSHNYSGSNLQSYIFTSSDFIGGKKTIPIPVNEILPQSIAKTMSAFRDTDHTWDVTKGATPASLNFGNVCDGSFSNTQGVAITVTWTKGPATPSGQASITTHVYATNPASRTIRVTVSDSIYAGTTQTTLIDTATLGPTDVPANTTMEVGSGHTVLTSDTSSHFNDVATATYTDVATGITVPGNTTATADADVATGTDLNSSATVTDSESITGSGLTFKTGLPSLVAGSFIPPSEAGAGVAYTADTYTVGPVTWSSGSQSDSDTTTFSKTVKLDPIQITSGTLSDTANLVGSDGFTTSYGPLNVNISSSATTTLTINKTIPDVLTGSETATFNFHVKATNDAGAADVASTSVTFTAGQTSKSATVNNLAPGTYYVFEDTATGWNAQSSQSVDLTLPSHCSNSVTFDNSVVQATATATKVTDPTGYQQGWTLTLTKPDSTTVPLSTDSSGNVNFGSLADEGSYTISETGQAGWTETGAVGSGGATGGATVCTFTVNYPADAGKSFGCTFTNQSRGTVRVVKTLNGGPLGTQSFTFELRQGSQVSTSTAALETKIASSANSGVLNFTTPLVPGQTYAICELLVANYGPDFDGYGSYNPGDNPGYLCLDFSITVAQAADTPSVTFNIDNSHAFTRALTIGYWKTHAPASCKIGKGKQSDDLTPALGSGFYLGSYLLTSPCKAVKLLNKQNINGTKEPGDPIFNMVAQEVGAKLNLANGAGSCQALTDALAQADQLLTDIHFNGVTYDKPLTDAQKQLANSLNEILDAYNNNNLC